MNTKLVLWRCISGILFLYCLFLLNQNFHQFRIIQDLEEQNIDLREQLRESQEEASWYHGAVTAHHDEEETKRKAASDHLRFIKDEVQCLAMNVAAEALREPANGQLAVATVTMNRVAASRGSRTVCEVVHQRNVDYRTGKTVCQFSWICLHRQPRVTPEIMAMARAVYFKHERSDEIGDSTLYHAYYTHPDWADKVHLVAQIGQHIFYRP